MHIGLVAYLSRHSAAIAPLVMELGYTFVVAQIDSMNKLLQPLASSNTGKLNLNSDVMCKSKLQRELSHRRECAAKKRFSTDRLVLALSLHQIFTSIHLRTESCFNCKIIKRLAISSLSKDLKTGEVTSRRLKFYCRLMSMGQRRVHSHRLIPVLSRWQCSRIPYSIGLSSLMQNLSQLLRRLMKFSIA